MFEALDLASDKTHPWTGEWDCKGAIVVVGIILTIVAQLLQLFTVDWDTTEDLGTSAASLGLELDFIGGDEHKHIGADNCILNTSR